MIREVTKFFIIGILVVIFAYDFYAYLQEGQEGTISYLIITDWSRNYPAFTFLIGFIMGHLFWPLSSKKRID